MTSEVHFENIDNVIKQYLMSAKESIKICVAWINRNEYLPIINQLSTNGVNIEIIFNNDTTNLNHGLPKSHLYTIYPIDTRLPSAFMHNKFCIIDNEIIINGSFNWSVSAKNSFENILIVKNDFKLVKSFLHEFNDLVSYYDSFNQNNIQSCYCRSHTYTLGIFGAENGLYNDSIVDIWRICSKNQHTQFIREENEQYIQSQLGLTNEDFYDDVDYNYIYDKSIMLSELKQEINHTNQIQNYFEQRSGNKINAIGHIIMNNHNEHIEWNEPAEYQINIIWKDMYYRKIIPNVLYNDYDDSIEKIIDKHCMI
jgi:hypothetical protein